MSNLPTTTPTEALAISPEALEVANMYLQCQDLHETASSLDIPPDIVANILGRREVKAYIDSVFLNVGFNNRFRMRKAMDALIRQKFKELEEAGTGSSKDIAELLALSHKMTMEELDRQIKLEQLKEQNIKNQLNVQINNAPAETNYGTLIQKLLNDDTLK